MRNKLQREGLAVVAKGRPEGIKLKWIISPPSFSNLGGWDELTHRKTPRLGRTGYEPRIKTIQGQVPMSDQITFDDCCRLILEQGAPPRNRPAPDKSDYRRDLLAVLNKEFGIGWNDGDEFQPSSTVWGAVEDPWNGGIPYITRNLARNYRGISDPFSEFLEYTFVNSEQDVWKVHKADIQDAAMVMRQRFIAFFRDLLLLRWPEAADHTTSWTRLRALGLEVPEDDPDGFF
jgi:hypothetical protein